ncbi:MAG: hypothetical protein MRY76_06540 [Pseudomonadales bacterium]|nr:hypothetical protein [Pseudomonadales bacterium]
MKIHILKVTEQLLNTMTSEERSFFLLAGHIENEINSLNKVFTWCLSNSDLHETTEIEKLADGMQGLLYARLLAGKLNEFWQVLQTSFFGSKLSKNIDPHLNDQSKKSLKYLKSYFGKKNIISNVRNNSAFHYSPEYFEKHWQDALGEDHFEFVFGGTVGNNVAFASELVANIAFLHEIDPTDRGNALSVFFKESQDVTHEVTEFIEGTLLAILEKSLGDSIGKFVSEEELNPSRSYGDIAIPHFIVPA